MKQNILVVVAHPDDEVLGCGGTIARHVLAGDKVAVLILGKGKSSRSNMSEGVLRQELRQLSKETTQAMKILGVANYEVHDFPDNMYDSIPLLQIVKRIEAIKEKTKPSTIYTHHLGDTNIDHRLTHTAVLTATRPMPGETVKSVYAFENPSSTEWNSYSSGTVFTPNYFVDISKTLRYKTKALAAYQSELRDYPHPRSLKYIEDLARLSGAKVGLPAVENFVLIRSIRGLDE